MEVPSLKWFTAAILAATFATPPIFASASRLKPPRYTHALVNIDLLYVSAQKHLRDELLRPTTTPRQFQNPLDRFRFAQTGSTSVSSKAKQIAYRRVVRIPLPKRYGRPMALRRPNDASVPVEVQLIALGRFSDTDCVLVPYVYSLTYDTTSGALLQEQANLASPTIAASNGLPPEMTVC
jgi:hypothetical protein